MKKVAGMYSAVLLILCVFLFVGCLASCSSSEAPEQSEDLSTKKKITISTDVEEVWFASYWWGEYYIPISIEFENFDEIPSEVYLCSEVYLNGKYYTVNSENHSVENGKMYFYVHAPNGAGATNYAGDELSVCARVYGENSKIEVESNIITLRCYFPVDSGTIYYVCPESARINISNDRCISLISGEEIEFSINLPDSIAPDEYVVVNMINNSFSNVGSIRQRCAVKDGKIKIRTIGDELYVRSKTRTGEDIRDVYSEEMREYTTNYYSLDVFYKGMECVPAYTSDSTSWGGSYIQISGEIEVSPLSNTVKLGENLEFSCAFKYFYLTPYRLMANARKKDSEETFRTSADITNNIGSLFISSAYASVGEYEIWFSNSDGSGESNHISITVTE